MSAVRTCRVCGCTEANACVGDSGACWWVAADLCSHCQEHDIESLVGLDDEDCSNCGGEGVVFLCLDGCCENAEEGCDVCMSTCDWCRP